MLGFENFYTAGVVDWLNGLRSVIHLLAFARNWPAQKSLTPLEIFFQGSEAATKANRKEHKEVTK